MKSVKFSKVSNNLNEVCLT